MVGLWKRWRKDKKRKKVCYLITCDVCYMVTVYSHRITEDLVRNCASDYEVEMGECGIEIEEILNIFSDLWMDCSYG